MAPICGTRNSSFADVGFLGASGLVKYSKNYLHGYYILLVLGYTCVNIPYGTLCGAMTQNIDERAKINTSRSVAAMIAIGIINIITVPLVSFFGTSSAKTGYLVVAAIYGCIFAACFQPVFKKLNNKGRTASVFALLTGICMLSLYFFNVKESAVVFYGLSGLTQFFFSGFNTAIYAIIPDCVEYGEWKTGLRNDGFQYAFVSLGNKVGMAIGTEPGRSTCKLINGSKPYGISDSFHWKSWERYARSFFDRYAAQRRNFHKIHHRR